MKTKIKHMINGFLICIFFTGAAFAGDMAGHDMATSGRIGDLIHESEVNGYMLAYHFMDLRDKKTDGHDQSAMDKSHTMPENQMDKPHHLMVYIMDNHHQPVLKGKVGFVIKDAQGNAQKEMGMFMSNGFGITADMKEKGVYTIMMKAIIGDEKIMDTFDYEIK